MDPHSLPHPKHEVSTEFPGWEWGSHVFTVGTQSSPGWCRSSFSAAQCFSATQCPLPRTAVSPGTTGSVLQLRRGHRRVPKHEMLFTASSRPPLCGYVQPVGSLVIFLLPRGFILGYKTALPICIFSFPWNLNVFSQPSHRASAGV